jgi:valyl-tRNA synthetase
MAKGFKGLFLREVDEVDETKVTQLPSVSASANTVDVLTDNVRPINEIYEESQLGIEGIYSIIGFLDGLPNELDTVSKKSTLLKMLNAAKFDIPKLYLDADERISVLNAYVADSALTATQEIETSEKQIAELKEAIEMLENKKKNTKEVADAQAKLIQEEVGKLKSLQSYVEIA